MRVQATGVVFYSIKTNRILLNYRSSTVSYPNTWGFFGGKIEKGEKALEALNREIKEEVGFVPPYISAYPIDVYQNIKNSFRYFSYFVFINDEFVPLVNNESSGWGWFSLDNLPKSLHGGVYSLVNSEIFLMALNSYKNKVKKLVNKS